MTWIGWAAVILGAIILTVGLTGYLAARAFADYGVKMLISFFEGPGDKE